MTKPWLKHKPLIQALYMDQKMTLEDTQKIMAERHGFVASTRAYRTQIEKWGWRKYNKKGKAKGPAPPKQAIPGPSLMTPGPSSEGIAGPSLRTAIASPNNAAAAAPYGDPYVVPYGDPYAMTNMPIFPQPSQHIQSQQNSYNADAQRLPVYQDSYHYSQHVHQKCFPGNQLAVSYQGPQSSSPHNAAGPAFLHSPVSPATLSPHLPQGMMGFHTSNAQGHPGSRRTNDRPAPSAALEGHAYTTDYNLPFQNDPMYSPHPHSVAGHQGYQGYHSG